MPLFQRERMPLTQTIHYDDFKGCNLRLLGLHEHCPIVPLAAYTIILHPAKKIIVHGGLCNYFAFNIENSSPRGIYTIILRSTKKIVRRGLYKISSCKSLHFAVKSGSFFED